MSILAVGAAQIVVLPKSRGHKLLGPQWRIAIKGQSKDESKRNMHYYITRWFCSLETFDGILISLCLALDVLQKQFECHTYNAICSCGKCHILYIVTFSRSRSILVVVLKLLLWESNTFLKYIGIRAQWEPSDVDATNKCNISECSKNTKEQNNIL